jgi:hypothetical protein
MSVLRQAAAGPGRREGDIVVVCDTDKFVVGFEGEADARPLATRERLAALPERNPPRIVSPAESAPHVPSSRLSGFSESPGIAGNNFLTRRSGSPKDGDGLPVGHAAQWRGLTACHRPRLFER